jgi:hypothetical protein
LIPSGKDPSWVTMLAQIALLLCHQHPVQNTIVLQKCYGSFLSILDEELDKKRAYQGLQICSGYGLDKVVVHTV